MLAERFKTDPQSQAAGAPEPRALPKIVVRGRSFLALIIAPEAPLDAWFAALDQHLGRAAALFAGRPVIVDLAGTADAADLAVQALDGLMARELRIIGVEGIEADLLAGTRWDGVPTVTQGGPSRPMPTPDDPPTTAPAADAAAPVSAPPAAAEPEAPASRAPPSLVIDRPVRSGQSILFEHGDVTVIGAVASGAEVIAGGSIHVYGALRGRAIAGLVTGEAARIFCHRLEAELVAVGGHYRTAEDWSDGLRGRSAQIWCDRGALRLAPLD